MTRTRDEEPCYEVGYGRPPVEYRFQKGVSGNPRGRKRGTKNFATLFMKAMTKSVTITENGRRRRISKLDAAVTQLANDAARGDKKAMQLAFALLQVLEPAPSEAQNKPILIYSGVLAEHDRTV